MFFFLQQLSGSDYTFQSELALPNEPVKRVKRNVLYRVANVIINERTERSANAAQTEVNKAFRY